MPVYLTVRPDWLVPRTRAFLRGAGFPEGIVRTMTNSKGSFGDGAAAYKLGELDELVKRGLVIGYGFGNMPSDIDAYAPRVELPSHRIFLQLEVPAGRGRPIASYGELLAELESSSPACR